MKQRGDERKPRKCCPTQHEKGLPLNGKDGEGGSPRGEEAWRDKKKKQKRMRMRKQEVFFGVVADGVRMDEKGRERIGQWRRFDG
jgi:hypothetical protein